MGIFDGYLLVSDMDGTLLNSKGKLSEENRLAIEYFVENGGKFTLATGRMVPSVKRFIDKINVNLPAILYNGTKIYDYFEEKTVSEAFLEEERKHIIKKVKELNPTFGIEIYSDETVYIYQECKYTERFSKLGYDVIYKVDESIWEKKWTKVLIIGEELEMDTLESEFNNIYDDGAIIRSGAKYVEIVPNNTSKGQALKELILAHKLDNYIVVSVGDNMNDLELIQEANYGFGVKNGNERLLKVAKYMAPSNDEHAIQYIVKWIEEIIRAN